ncbi:MAG: heme exporter protein CcmD [Alphaproteobacteria bacterium]
MMESILPGVARWLAQWSSMGGYAAFVWPAYAVAAAVLGGLAWHSWRAHRISETLLDRLQPRARRASARSRSR